MAKRGRKSAYTERLARKICELTAERDPETEQMRSLRQIAQLPGIPPESTIRRWLSDGSHPDFAAQYRSAWEINIRTRADDMLEVAWDDSRDTPLDNGKGGETPNGTAVNRDKLKINTLMWTLARVLPKEYGDKTEEQIEAGPITINLRRGPDRPSAKALAEQKKHAASS